MGLMDLGLMGGLMGTVTNGGPSRDVRVENFRLGKRTRINCGAQGLPQEYNESAFSSDFVNRSAKPSAFMEKGDIWLNGPPFGTVAYFSPVPANGTVAITRGSFPTV